MEGPESRHACPHCRRVQRENAELRRRLAELEAQVLRQARTIERLTEQIGKLQAALEQAQRAGQRQAAPFRKGLPKAEPKKPGRKPGQHYGRHARRPAPPPPAIDERIEVPLPETCPHCGGRALEETGTVEQFQTEIPRRAIHRQFQIRVGQCADCGKRVQGRHELQSSDATGAAAVQLGPQAHAALTILNKQMGLSHGKCAQVFRSLFGIRIARATSARSMLRTARRCQPSYEALRETVRASPAVSADETGWRVGGRSAWLHVFVGEGATCYGIDPSRSHRPAERLLGPDWSGTLIHDGWSPYDRFWRARHQQCLAHLLRRCRELLETATRGAVRFPRAVKELLQGALRLRDRYAAGQISPHGLAVARGRLQARLWRRIEPTKTNLANERLAAHLGRHFDHLFTFLAQPAIDATTWRAEQAIRPAVVNRKVWGGNRTWRGAWAQAVLMSVLETCRQQSRPRLDFLCHTLCSPSPVALLGATR